MGITDDPNNPCLKKIQPDGQQACYLVLSEEERAKGFVRPVRRTYRHVGPVGPKYPLRDLTAEEKDMWKDDPDPFVVFEEYPEELKAQGRTGRYWTQAQIDRVNKGGCGTDTSMGQAIAETYSRNPNFYGKTYCSFCRAHYPVGSDGEFIWIDDGTRVGT